MAGDSNVIKEFMIGLGFKTEESSFASFMGGIATATIAVKAMDAVIGFATSAVKGMIDSVPKLAEEIYGMSRAAKAAGTSMEELQKLEYIATIMDSSKDAVRSSMSELSKNAGLAAMGMGRAKVMFEEMNIAVKDSNGKLKNSSTLLKEVGVAVQGMEKGQAKAVLDRLGIDSSMLGMLTKDVSGLSTEFDKMFGAAGIQGMNQLAEEGDELGDNIDRIKYAVEMLRKSFLSRFITPVGKAVKWVADWVLANMGKIQKAVKPVIDWALLIGNALGAIGKQFFAVVGVIWGWLEKIVGGLKDLNDATGGWAKYIALVIGAWKLLNSTFLASPIGMVLGLAAAIALLVDDFQGWKEGADSLIDWGRWEPAITAAMNAIKSLWGIIEGLGKMIGAFVSTIVSLLTGDFAGAWEGVKGYVEGVIEVFKNLWGVVSGVGESIGNLAGGIADLFGKSSRPELSPETRRRAAAADKISDLEKREKVAKEKGDQEGLKSIQAERSQLFESLKQPVVMPNMGGQKLTPPPATAATLNKTSQNISQKTEIHVDGAGDPKAVAREVTKAQNRVNQDMQRNMRTVAQ